MSALAWMRGAGIWLAVGAVGGVCLVAIVLLRLARGEHVEPPEDGRKRQLQDANDK